ncbi:hypothetical protein TNCV_4924641 [Trichonephila clavipes]|nr:hypothetical protein TNCV_4924641 [Trichonephila clavipes]
MLGASSYYNYLRIDGNVNHIVTSVQEESDPVDDETDKDENNNHEIVRIVHLRLRQLWSGTNNNQSAVLLNYCC